MCEVIGSRTAKNREDFVPTARSPDEQKATIAAGISEDVWHQRSKHYDCGQCDSGPFPTSKIAKHCH